MSKTNVESDLEDVLKTKYREATEWFNEISALSGTEVIVNSN